MIRFQVVLLAWVGFVRLCAAQASGWNLDAGQINTTMCYWTAPRVGVIRDTVYIDGGYLWWQPGMKDGTYGGQIGDGNPLGLVYLLNFSQPFNTSSNMSNIFTTISKAAGGAGGLANNIGPNYVDGAMFVNDYEWFTYGGLLQKTDAFPTQDGDKVAAYQQYPTIPKQFSPGYIIETLPDGITRYVTFGAAASAPSENLGFYFGGQRSSSWGEILQNPARNASLSADTSSLTMIQLDMTTQGSEKWSNVTLPSEAPGRASAELVWVPVSTKGILVAIGGATYPSYANLNRSNNATIDAISEQQSPVFLSTVSVYDIESSTWYEQETSSPPSTLARGCTVLASALDGSSHNIYWYGGFDGIHEVDQFNDDVWVLSLPSFTWTKVATGTSTHGRSGHKCVKPYPDQMLSIGGYSSLSGLSPKCLEGGIIQIFNLSSAEWIDTYDPNIWSNYTVPTKLLSQIGGSPTGGATLTTPSPSGFSDSKLASLFSTTYDATKLSTWYPYAAITTPTPSTTPLPTPVPKSSSGTPKYLAPVLGVVLGLFFITLVILAFLLWRRRKYLRSNPTASSESGTMDNRHWVTNWLRSTPADAKAPTVTTDDTPMTPYEDTVAYMPEVAGTQVHEMDDTSRPVELQATGFHPLPTRGHSHLKSSHSVTSQTSRTSTVSRELPSPSPSSLSRPPISPLHTPRADSPTGGRLVSGVSNVSETDRGHLRGISETSLSSDGFSGAYGTPMEVPGGGAEGLALRNLPAPEMLEVGSGSAQGERGAVVSPLTPPDGVGEGEGGDYLGAGEVQVKRKSNFAEGLD